MTPSRRNNVWSLQPRCMHMMQWDKAHKPRRLDIEVADVCQLERHQLLFVLRPSHPVSAGTRRPATGHIIACDEGRDAGRCTRGSHCVVCARKGSFQPELTPYGFLANYSSNPKRSWAGPQGGKQCGTAWHADPSEAALGSHIAMESSDHVAQHFCR